jgi:hypothetical protein
VSTHFNSPFLLAATATLLVLACGGQTSSSEVDAGGADAQPTDGGHVRMDGAVDGGVVADGGGVTAACKGCLALHCQSYGMCERDPACMQAVADYTQCTRQSPIPTCIGDLQNNTNVPGDIVLCMAASCTTDCSGL